MKKKLYTKEQKQSFIKEFYKSGLSQAEFQRKEGIPKGSLCYWLSHPIKRSGRVETVSAGSFGLPFLCKLETNGNAKSEMVFEAKISVKQMAEILRMIAVLALMLILPSIAQADALQDALTSMLNTQASKNTAIQQQLDLSGFIAKQNYIETGNIYGDRSQPPAFGYQYNGVQIDLGQSQRKYEVQKYEYQQSKQVDWSKIFSN